MILTIDLSIPLEIISDFLYYIQWIVLNTRLTEGNIIFDVLGFLLGIWIIPSGILEFSFCMTVSMNMMESTKEKTNYQD